MAGRPLKNRVGEWKRNKKSIWGNCSSQKKKKKKKKKKLTKKTKNNHTHQKRKTQEIIKSLLKVD